MVPLITVYGSRHRENIAINNKFAIEVKPEVLKTNLESSWV